KCKAQILRASQNRIRFHGYQKGTNLIVQRLIVEIFKNTYNLLIITSGKLFANRISNVKIFEECFIDQCRGRNVCRIICIECSSLNYLQLHSLDKFSINGIELKRFVDSLLICKANFGPRIFCKTENRNTNFLHLRMLE